MVERDAVNKFVDFGQISNVRVFSFPAGVAFIQLSKHIHKLNITRRKAECKELLQFCRRMLGLVRFWVSLGNVSFLPCNVHQSHDI